MAEPDKLTNRIVSREDRKRRLVRRLVGTSKTKLYVWSLGHTLCVIFGSITMVFQVLWLPKIFYINSICYRLCLLGATTAYLATLSHKFGLHHLPPFTTLLAQHNFQYLILSVIWCFTFKSVFKIVPLYLISLLQLADHKKIAFVQKHGDVLGAIIGFTEISFIFYLLIRTLTFRSTSGYQLAIFLIFIWLRILFDSLTSHMFAYVVDKADVHVSKIKHEKVAKVWTKVKNFLEDKQSAGI